MAQQYVIDELMAIPLRTILAAGRGAGPASASQPGSAGEATLAELGIEIAAVRLAGLAAEADVQRALQQPTREAIQQQADEAMFGRRALAVEKERAIAENELSNKIELARREEDLVAREGANEQRRAEEHAAAEAITAQGTDEIERMAAQRRADALREMEQAKLEAERTRAEINSGLGDPAPGRARGPGAGRPAGQGRAPHDHARADHPVARQAHGVDTGGVTMVPRCVLIERPTEYQELIARHGTHDQAAFFLAQRGQRIEDLRRRHDQHRQHHQQVLGAVPPEWRRASIQRDDLDRFLFEPDDVIVVLGQDGLVANVAKYLDQQPVLGLNPEPERNPGVLVTHPPDAAGELMRDLQRGRAPDRAPDHGHGQPRRRPDPDRAQRAVRRSRSHQSARYTIALAIPSSASRPPA